MDGSDERSEGDADELVVVEGVVDEEQLDPVSGALWAVGVAGLEERRLDDGVLLVVSAAGRLADLVVAALRAGGAVDVGPATPAAAATTGAHRPFAPVTRVGRVVVRPPWRAAEVAAGDLELLVDPGTSFGHGAHATTQLALAGLQQVPLSGASVLDAGCGSGVLAVGAALLGAARVVAVDVDPAAVATTRANARRSGVAVVEATRGDVRDLGDVEERFDVVVANLEAPVLDAVGSVLVDRAGPGGHLVVTGFLADQRGRVQAALGGVALVASDELDGWGSLVGTAQGNR